MLIQDLFKRDIFRPINGVVKADQLDESSVWQELDEFVITRESWMDTSASSSIPFLSPLTIPTIPK